MGGHSPRLKFSTLKESLVSSEKLKCSMVHCSRATCLKLIGVKICPKVANVRVISNILVVLFITSKFQGRKANMKSPYGPILTVDLDGVDSCLVDIEDVIICLLTVLTPILAKRVMSMVMIRMETIPPEADVYYA